MKTQKIYIATGNQARLNIEIKVKSKFRRVDFSNGGLSSNGNARLQTSDPDVQKALESSPMFGKMYKLQSQRQLQETEKQVEQEPASQSKKQAISSEHMISPEGISPEGDNTNPDASEPIIFPNFNALRDYLVSEHGCPPAEVRSLDSALAAAKSLGIEVTIE